MTSELGASRLVTLTGPPGSGALRRILAVLAEHREVNRIISSPRGGLENVFWWTLPPHACESPSPRCASWVSGRRLTRDDGYVIDKNTRVEIA